MATIYIRAGDDETINLDFDIDITGATVDFVIKYRRSDTDANAAISKSVTSHTDASAGQTTVTLTDTETAAITPCTAYWQARVIASGGSVRSTVEGICVIRENIIDNE